MPELPYNHLLTPKSIWLIKQNKPSLIAEDLACFGVDKATIHKVLLARGVYKWLSVRRKLITTKNIWKDRIKDTLSKIVKAKQEHVNTSYLKGYLKAYEECRKEIRELCHSERWQAPDFDIKANQFLKGLNP